MYKREQIDGLVQERCNSIALGLELHLSCYMFNLFCILSYFVNELSIEVT